MTNDAGRKPEGAPSLLFWVGAFVAFNELRRAGSLNQVGTRRIFRVFVEFAVTPLDQLRLRLTDHDFDRLMQSAEPLAAPDREAFLKDIAAELSRYEVVGPGLLHRIIMEAQQRYDIADQRRDKRDKTA